MKVFRADAAVALGVVARGRASRWRPAKDHPWKRFDPNKPHKQRNVGIDWVTGEKLMDTLEGWVRSAVKGGRGVVLNRKLTLELAVRLNIPTGHAGAGPSHREVTDREVAKRPHGIEAHAAFFEYTDGLLLDGGDGISPSDDDPDDQPEPEK